MVWNRLSGWMKVACIFSLVALLGPGKAVGLISGVHGNQPVKNLGWPLGSEQVANIESRLGYWEGPPFGGGEYHFLFRDDPTAFNQALQLFAQIQAPRLELLVQDGPQHSFWLDDRPADQRESTSKPAGARVDWELIVWCPRNWHHLFNSPRGVFMSMDADRFRHPVPPPQIVLYIGGGQIEWEQVRVPAGVVVVDRRDQTHGAGTQLQVQVSDMATAQPVAKPKVVLQQYRDRKWSELVSVEGSSAGFAELSVRQHDGDRRLVVSAEGYAPRRVTWLSTGDARQPLRVELAHAGELSGFVTAADGARLEGVDVRVSTTIGLDGASYLMPEPPSTKTSAEGAFVIQNLPEGYVTLTCRKEGWQQKTRVIQGISLLDIYEVSYPQFSTVHSEIQIGMVGTGIISGTLVDPQGQPFTGEADVSLEAAESTTSWGGSLHTQDGKFEFKGVPPAKYYISTNPGMRFEKDPKGIQTIEVTASKVTTVKVVHDSKAGPHSPPHAVTRPAKP